MAALIAGFPASGQAKNGAQKPGAAPDPEQTPLEAGTAQGASGTAQGASGTAQGASGTAQGASGTAQGASGTAQGASGIAQGASGGAVSALGVSTWDFVRAFLVLALVVGSIYLLFHLLKKGMGRKTQENDMIRVLGSRNLAGSRSMHLVEVGKCVFLVGSTDGGVELISEITDQESLDMLRLQAAEEPAAGRRSFPEVLADLIKPTKRQAPMSDGVKFLRGQRERLKKL